MGRSGVIGFVLAWVLWADSYSLTSDGGSTLWTVKDAAETKTDCEELAERYAAGIEQWKTDKMVVVRINGAQAWIINAEAAWLLRITYKCLPDTVDPRPKP